MKSTTEENIGKFEEFNFAIEAFNKLNMDVPTENGLNSLIKGHVLSDEEMRDLGFTDHSKTRWYFSKRIKYVQEISFSITIDKTNSDIEIDVLDEAFLQPYDYQAILNRSSSASSCNYALVVHSQVQYWMKKMQDEGVISGYVPNDYI